VTEQPLIADGVERQLDPRSIPVQQIAGLIFAALVGGGSLVGLLVWAVAGATLWSFAGRLVVWLVLFTLLVWHAYRWPTIEHRYSFYRVDEDGIEIRRGVYWRIVINVPRSRVQHTDVSQGPLERRYCLGTLTIYTAGTDHAKVELSGLEHGTALRIREHLLPRESSDAV
jgi:uncharacterized protein